GSDDLDDIFCYRRGVPGHKARNCIAVDYCGIHNYLERYCHDGGRGGSDGCCFKCGEDGHIAKDWPNKPDKHVRR
nr:hypothetical protein [Tanacetum cinerariifolium]